LDLRVKP